MDADHRAAVVELYDWLDGIPFSRTKKYLARDFSDAVFCAELVKHFGPSLVEIHNYPTTHSFAQKIVNWQLLNSKVLRKKLDLNLSDETIEELASAKLETTERLLKKLKQRMESIEVYEARHKQEMGHLAKNRAKQRTTYLQKRFPSVTEDSQKSSQADGQANEDEASAHIVEEESHASSSSIETNTNSQRLMRNSVDDVLNRVLRQVQDAVPFNGARVSEDSQEGARGRNSQMQECEEAIKFLTTKIQKLEKVIQVKDFTIARQQFFLEQMTAGGESLQCHPMFNNFRQLNLDDN